MNGDGVLKEIRVRRTISALRKEKSVLAFDILKKHFAGLRMKAFERFRRFYSSDEELRKDLDSIFWETAVGWDESRNKSAIRYLMTMYLNNCHKAIRATCLNEYSQRKKFKVFPCEDMTQFACPKKDEIGQSLFLQMVAEMLAKRFNKSVSELLLQHFVDNADDFSEFRRITRIRRIGKARIIHSEIIAEMRTIARQLSLTND